MENKQLELASKYLTYRSAVKVRPIVKKRKGPLGSKMNFVRLNGANQTQFARKLMKKVAKEYQEIYGTKLTASKAKELLNVERIFYD